MTLTQLMNFLTTGLKRTGKLVKHAIKADDYAVRPFSIIESNVLSAFEDVSYDQYAIAYEETRSHGTHPTQTLLFKKEARLLGELVNLAERIDELRRNSIKSGYRDSLPVVQVNTIIDAIAETAHRGKEPCMEDIVFVNEKMYEWTSQTQCFADPQLIFSTVGLWLGYAHDLVQRPRHKKRVITSDDCKSPMFFNMIEGRPRRDYSTFSEVVESLQYMTCDIGTPHFRETLERRYFE